MWTVEFDGPSHFLASGSPTGATMLNRRHLQLMGRVCPTGSGTGAKGQARGSSI